MWHDQQRRSPTTTLRSGGTLLWLAVAGACQGSILHVTLRAPDEPAVEAAVEAADARLPTVAVAVRDERTSRVFVGDLGRPVVAHDVPAWVEASLQQATGSPPDAERDDDAPAAIRLAAGIERVWCATNGRALTATVELTIRYEHTACHAERRYAGQGRYEKADFAAARFGAWHARRALHAALLDALAGVRTDLRAFAATGSLPDR